LLTVSCYHDYCVLMATIHEVYVSCCSLPGYRTIHAGPYKSCNMTHCSVLKWKAHYTAVYDGFCVLTLFLISLFQQKTHGWDRDHSKTLFTSTIAKATCLSYTMQEAGSKWRGNTLPLSRLIQYWQSPQSKLDAPFLSRSMRLQIFESLARIEKVPFSSFLVESSEPSVFVRGC